MTQIYRIVAIALIGALGTFEFSSAAGLGALAGVVKDAAGKPIAGAVVIAASARAVYSATSETAGSFEIKLIPEGVYSLDVTASGYQRVADQVVAVRDGSPTEIQLVLLPASASALATIGRVTVNGSRALSTASAPTVDLDPQDLAGRGVEQLSDVLGAQTAVSLTRQIGGAPGLPQSASIRGPDPSETVIDVDGHQVNNSNTGDYALELIDPSGIHDFRRVDREIHKKNAGCFERAKPHESV